MTLHDLKQKSTELRERIEAQRVGYPGGDRRQFIMSGLKEICKDDEQLDSCSTMLNELFDLIDDV